MKRFLRFRALALCLLLLICLSSCSENQSGMYSKAVKSFAAGEYGDAAALFERLGDYADAPTYAAYSRGLTLFDQGFYADAEPYFEKSRGFMYGEQR
ncbi:MAG: hypothetical protein RSA55_03055, partial [Clostridia bacterium]